jgi:hypothetical protein
MYLYKNDSRHLTKHLCVKFCFVMVIKRKKNKVLNRRIFGSLTFWVRLWVDLGEVFALAVNVHSNFRFFSTWKFLY